MCRCGKLIYEWNKADEEKRKEIERRMAAIFKPRRSNKNAKYVYECGLCGITILQRDKPLK